MGAWHWWHPVSNSHCSFHSAHDGKFIYRRILRGYVRVECRIPEICSISKLGWGPEWVGEDFQLWVSATCFVALYTSWASIPSGPAVSCWLTAWPSHQWSSESTAGQQVEKQSYHRWLCCLLGRGWVRGGKNYSVGFIFTANVDALHP